MIQKINFVTTNAYKFEIAKQFFNKLPQENFEISQYDVETSEIQDESEEEIARHSALWVSRQLGELAISSDVGFHIDSLGGFPGPFVKYVNKWLQPNDVLNAMRQHKDRSARFIDVLALAFPNGESHTFAVKTPGVIVDTETVPDTNWTMDAIFIPDGHSKTLVNMSDTERDSVWNDEAWRQLINQLMKGDRNV